MSVNIDGPIVRGLKRLQKREGTPLGRLLSELLQALGGAGASHGRGVPSAGSRSRLEHQWTSPIGRAIRAVLEGSDGQEMAC